jgi:hypothetical protein
MTYNLHCLSNSLMDDSLRLRIFQRTLTGGVVKWYIELKGAYYGTFTKEEMVFLTHFQLHVRYETGKKLLTSLQKNTSTHILEHVHEWKHHCTRLEQPSQTNTLWIGLKNLYFLIFLGKYPCQGKSQNSKISCVPNILTKYLFTKENLI